MNKGWTQLAVSVIGMIGLVIITGIVVTLQMLGEVTANGDMITGMLVGGLTSVTSMAAAWLFRLNGSNERKQ